MRTRSILLLGLMTLLPPALAHGGGKCDAGGQYEAEVLAAREVVRASCDCANASSHAAYVRCAGSVIRQLTDDGTLPRMCRGRVRQFASRSTCGDDDVVACCLQARSGRWRAARRSVAKGGCVAPAGGAACEASFRHLEDACLPDVGCRFGGCGDGTVNPSSEQCEPPGTPTCDRNCQYIHACGNGVVDFYPNEECEPPGTATCDASCRFIHTCGNGVIEPGEECDGQPACGADCILTREACCEFGDACVSERVTNGFDAYWRVFKLCVLVLNGTGSYGSCEGDPCPPPAPLGLGCRVGSCEDRPIDPLPLCCNAPDGTCLEVVATTGGTIAGFCSYFLPPDQGDVPHMMLGSCGGDGRCVPLASDTATATP